jgi:uncharacterized membrane protein
MRVSKHVTFPAINRWLFLPYSLPPRLLLFFFAVLVQIGGEVFSWYSLKTGNPLLIFLAVVVWFLWFALVFLLAKPSTDNLLRPYRKGIYITALVIVMILAIMGIGEIVGIHLVNTGVVDDNELAESLTYALSYNDSTAINHQASQQLIEGINPYSNSNIVKAYDEFEVPVESLTPLRQGSFAEVFPYPTKEQLNEAINNAKDSPDTPPPEFESKVSYPAGSFLFQVPLVALGLQDTRVFYLLCGILMLVVLFLLAPKRLRFLVIIAFITNLMLWNLIGTGTIDILYVLFIFLGWILMRRNLLLSALFIGLAATTKQIAWLLVLFYLVLLLRELGWKQALRSMGVIGATFTVVNMPFIFGAPQAWLEGVLAPIFDPMFPSGDGIVAFSIAGILPPNSLLYTMIEIAVLVAALVWYYFNCRKYPQTGLLLAVLPLFFAWRSYSCYFCFASLLIFGAVIIAEYGKSITGAQPQPITPTHLNLDTTPLSK